MGDYMRIPLGLLKMAKHAEERVAEVFSKIDAVSEHNTQRVLESFWKNKVCESCFAGTTGYGYDDRGREVLDRVFADVFGTQAALVRTGFVNGTHAISAALFACAEPGTTLLSATGAPYDTLRTVIGTSAMQEHGSLSAYGTSFKQIELKDSGEPDYGAIRATVGMETSAVFIQRSRGYTERRALSIDEIEKIIQVVKEKNPGCVTVVDNCYGEFVCDREPSHIGADLIAGSLIKNPGGGLAPTGGYVAGSRKLVERAANRLTTPGIGGECGPTLGQSRLLFQGLFMAPHIVAQALKTAVFCAAMLEEAGYYSSPGPFEDRSDIIQAIRLGSPELLSRFCAGIQHAAPVDSFAIPVASQMPGYDCPVIMAAGSFVQGASIELSCDGPMREPYTAFLQGALTYESGKLGVILSMCELMEGLVG